MEEEEKALIAWETAEPPEAELLSEEEADKIDWALEDSPEKFMFEGDQEDPEKNEF